MCRYWDIPFNNYQYSYIDNALLHGYHTLSYDRLGIGNSSHGEPKNEIQAFLEVASLAQIVENYAARNSLNYSIGSINCLSWKMLHILWVSELIAFAAS